MWFTFILAAEVALVAYLIGSGWETPAGARTQEVRS